MAAIVGFGILLYRSSSDVTSCVDTVGSLQYRIFDFISNEYLVNKYATVTLDIIGYLRLFGAVAGAIIGIRRLQTIQ